MPVLLCINNVRMSVVPVTAVVGVAVEGMCPSALNVSWTPLSPRDLRGPDHASFYYITYNDTALGQPASVSTPYLTGPSVRTDTRQC